MKLKAVSLTALAIAAGALVSACGGGGGTAAPTAVRLGGVAAVGLALADSTVDVKCASGTGSATTDGSGAYTVTVENGALPCIIKVSGTANGVPVTLHSVAEAGTTSGSTTTATANVTPLTELILARAGGALPSDLFANFGNGAAISGAALTQATTDVLAALSTAAGVDLTRWIRSRPPWWPPRRRTPTQATTTTSCSTSSAPRSVRRCCRRWSARSPARWARPRR